jgi:hypothetical protein
MAEFTAFIAVEEFDELFHALLAFPGSWVANVSPLAGMKPQNSSCIASKRKAIFRYFEAQNFPLPRVVLHSIAPWRNAGEWTEHRVENKSSSWLACYLRPWRVHVWIMNSYRALPCLAFFFLRSNSNIGLTHWSTLPPTVQWQISSTCQLSCVNFRSQRD